MLKTIESIDDMKKIVKDLRASGHTIGLVPTMGSLHAGHASLITRSVNENDITIVSIFVNPTQFGAGEDYEMYPRDLDKDSIIADKVGADYIFAPKTSMMYPKGYNTFISVENVSIPMCGVSRPGHFKGVATVVNKLFNICSPDKAYFGQKDYQQTVVIKSMVKDLDMDIKVVICPIVREADGLAMSSRNTYLSPDDRTKAPFIYRALLTAKDQMLSGINDPEKVKKIIKNELTNADGSIIDYIDIRDPIDLGEIQTIDIEKGAVIAIALKLGSTRLIDNILIGGTANADHTS